ncbi:ABC transporter ATP-binding protein (plasmid) [Natrinema zhouii]|uniref:ABC transporter ATP-binding protein n=1 Tax=Natrinema zhouii TaxID=1710539 RepID=UPI001CFFDC0C|nr:ABC transporter ATP-binding protein [Natrinema zhouii]UHQ98757.1 ABC transporter ATP-binding protein [Natrinema zhouii]
MNTVEIENVNAGYGTGQVLFDVSLEIEEGEIVSLLGRNGAGKSTMMRCVAGAKPPHIQSGTIRVNGEDITDLATHKRVSKGIGYVPEERRVWPGLTISENIRMAINNTADPMGFDEVLSYFPRLQELEDKAARNLSGGEQQMLAIARALASNPNVMLMDEPSEGLAPYIVRDVEQVIRQLNEEEGLTIFLVEQNVVMAMDVSDRHYFLDQGEIVDEMTPTKLQENPEVRQQYLSV